MPIGHSGSWFGLPDFGITERLTGSRTSQGGSNLVGPKANYSPPAVQGVSYGDQNIQKPVNYGNQNVPQPRSNSVPTTNTQIPTNNFNTGVNHIQQAQDNGNSQLDREYEIAMGELGNQEQGLRSQAGSAEGAITNEAAVTKTTLGAEQATKEQGVQRELSTAETQSKSALQQARDLFRQTQQSNSAQLSALGISSSSVSEALAERLGVETARRIAGVTGSLDEVRQNSVQELGRIKNYYSERATQVQQQVELQKAQIQQALIQGLNTINSARQKAASDKASARANLLSQVQSQLFSLTQQQQQFEQSLKAWAEQKAAALTPIAQDPNYIQNLLANTQKIQQQFDPSQFVATPQINMNQKGEYSGQISLQKPPKEEDQLVNPFLQ